MANPLPKKMNLGTIGELLVQLRLLQYNVQAAPPLKDTGNDLIAIKGESVRFLQVKSTQSNNVSNLNKLKTNIYHILAIVKLEKSEEELFLDRSRIFLIPKDELPGNSLKISDINQYELSRMIDKIWDGNL